MGGSDAPQPKQQTAPAVNTSASTSAAAAGPVFAADTVRPPAVEPAAGVSPPIVGVGASAGGLEAFTELLSHLPDDTGMAFVLIQHLDPSHDSHLTELLSKESKMPVSEVKGETRVEANHVYVIPPRCNLSISGGVLHEAGAGRGMASGGGAGGLG